MSITKTPVLGGPAPMVDQALEQLPFGIPFQAQLLRIFLEESGIAIRLKKYLKPDYFDSPPLQWAYALCQRYYDAYQTFPTIGMLQDQVRHLNPDLQPIYHSALEQVRTQPRRDDKWILDQTVEFIRRNLFVRMIRDSKQLYNSGKTTEAYDQAMSVLEELLQVRLEDADRGWLFEELPFRQTQRLDTSVNDAIPTGLPTLDKILHGGLSLGELGCWVGYAKGGKSTLLVNAGVACARFGAKPFLHCVLEGSRKQIEERYDSAFMGEVYTKIRVGAIDKIAYESAMDEYRKNTRLAVVRGFTDKWDYTIEDIHAEMKELKESHHWDPKLIVVDYGDLLTGRKKYYRSATDSQTDAYKDLKSLANRGYAIWTASQAKRPEKDMENVAHVIKGSDVADAYAKVRVCDFIGSINQTTDEYKAGVALLYYELYRSNEANVQSLVKVDFARMSIKEDQNVISPSRSDDFGGTTHNYATQQIMVPTWDPTQKH